MNHPQRPTETPRPVLPSHGDPTPPAYSCVSCGGQVTLANLDPKHLPSHMKLNEWPVPFPISSALTLIFTSLCTISYGHKDLYHVWRTCNEDGPDWMARKERLAQRISNVTIVGALLVSASVAFLTTNPPVEGLLDFNEQGPYICLLLSFGLTLGGLVIGSSLLYAMPICQGPWFRATLMGSRSHVCCTLIFVTYPFITIGISTVVMAMGLLAACWNSQNNLVRKSCSVVLLIPMSIIMLFARTQLPLLKSMVLHKQPPTVVGTDTTDAVNHTTRNTHATSCATQVIQDV